MMFEKVTFWLAVSMIAMPWIIIIFCCIAGGEISFSSKGIIPQIKDLLGR